MKAIDFSHVSERHQDIHGRLENWARWLRNGPRKAVSPMFRLYRSEYVWEAPEVGYSVDSRDAWLMEKGVVSLPEKHRSALQWCYVVRCTPVKACRVIGASLRELSELVEDGRQMLLNRRV